MNIIVTISVSTMAAGPNLTLAKAYFINQNLFYPFGDGEIIQHFNTPTLFKCTDASNLSVSCESKLGMHLMQIAGEFECEGLEVEGRINISNPNYLHTLKRYSLISKYSIFYEGVLKIVDNVYFLYKIID